MKKTIILAFTALSVALASCNPDVKYTSKPFVYFDNPLVTVPEDAGSVKIAVSVLGVTQDVQVGYELVSDVANPTAHFSLADPDNTILFFSPSKQTDFIEVNIVNEPGVRAFYSFTINLINKSAGVEFGGYSSCKVSISDNDHPLKDVMGEYTAKDKNGNAWPMTFLEDPDNEGNVLIDGLSPALAGGYVEKNRMWTFKGAVSKDLSSVRVSLGGKLPEPYDDLLPELLGIDLQGYLQTSGNIEFRKQEDGSYVSNIGPYLGIVDWNAGRILSQVDYAEPPITLVKK